MPYNLKFYGAWISPDGNIHETNDIVSHKRFFQALNLQDEILAASKKIIFTNKEIQLGYNKDLSFIAMKLGYVRITSIMNQVGIETVSDLSKINEQVKKSLFSFLEKIISNIKNNYQIVVEIFGTTKYKSYLDIEDLIKDS